MNTKSRKIPTIPLNQRELLRGPELAAILGLGRGAFYRARKERQIPEPVHVDGIPGWRRREILDWLDSGCPSPFDWKWRPTLPVKLEDLIALRLKQAVALDDEIKELQA